MRFWSMVFLFVFPALVAANAVDPVRPLDHSAAATLAGARQRSAIVRQLLEALAGARVIAHFEMSRQLPSGIGGTTCFVASRGGYRYLRIAVSSALPANARVAMLGHELQHAVEIAQSPAHDLAAMRQLWLDRGYTTNGLYFETQDALRVERAVRRELASRASETEPVVKLHHQHLRARGAKAAAKIAKR